MFDKTPGRLHISVSKKVVPLATRRNRLKRLIREATRQDPFFLDKTKLYQFRILRLPVELDFKIVCRTIETLKNE